MSRTDFQRGLYAIATAAEKILGDYRAADDSSAVDVTRVRGYLHPPSPNGGSLADEIARRNAEAGA